MTIQAIINTAQNIEIDRRKTVGQTISRSQHIKSSERLTANPFVITVTPLARWRYSENRGVLESIMNNDRHTETQVNLASTSRLNYVTEYRGSLTSTQLSAMTITNFTNTEVTIHNLPTTSSSVVVFRAGDFIQPALSRYPYIVTNDVTRGTGSTVTATVHRNLITSEATTITGAFLVGTATTMRLLVADLPTYKLVERDWAEFTGDFKLVEKVI